MEEEELLKTTPHLKNINADPLMSGQIRYMLKDGRNSIGKKDPNGPPVAVQIAGAGIVVNHANIKFDSSSGSSTIYPNDDDPQKSKVTVNGELLIAPRELQHGDRVLIGSHNYFIYCDPNINPDEMVEWESAMKEANKDQMNIAGSQDNEEI